MARKAKRLDDRLIEEGLCATLREAQAMIMTGKIFVDGNLVTKPGAMVHNDSSVTSKATLSRFATRGGYKLEKALKAFSVSVADRVALDAGAAGGGFTDCLLQHGAKRVYAVDVGFGQMKGRLAADPRVINLERMNISDLSPAILDMPMDLCTMDLSYLTLVQAVPIVRGLFTKPHEIICLIKPLYEGLSPESKADPIALHGVLVKLFQDLAVSGNGPSDVTSSRILGTRESVEFLCVIRADSPPGGPDLLADKAIAELRANPPVSFEEAVEQRS